MSSEHDRRGFAVHKDGTPPRRPTREASSGARCGNQCFLRAPRSTLHVLVDPLDDEVGDLVAVLVLHQHVAVAADARASADASSSASPPAAFTLSTNAWHESAEVAASSRTSPARRRDDRRTPSASESSRAVAICAASSRSGTAARSRSCRGCPMASSNAACSGKKPTLSGPSARRRRAASRARPCSSRSDSASATARSESGIICL